jgi:hypothetical protein
MVFGVESVGARKVPCEFYYVGDFLCTSVGLEFDPKNSCWLLTYVPCKVMLPISEITGVELTFHC